MGVAGNITNGAAMFSLGSNLGSLFTDMSMTSGMAEADKQLTKAQGDIQKESLEIEALNQIENINNRAQAAVANVAVNMLAFGGSGEGGAYIIQNAKSKVAEINANKTIKDASINLGIASTNMKINDNKFQTLVKGISAVNDAIGGISKTGVWNAFSTDSPSDTPTVANPGDASLHGGK